MHRVQAVPALQVAALHVVEHGVRAIKRHIRIVWQRVYDPLELPQDGVLGAATADRRIPVVRGEALREREERPAVLTGEDVGLDRLMTELERERLVCGCVRVPYDGVQSAYLRRPVGHRECHAELVAQFVLRAHGDSIGWSRLRASSINSSESTSSKSSTSEPSRHSSTSEEKSSSWCRSAVTSSSA